MSPYFLANSALKICGSRAEKWNPVNNTFLALLDVGSKEYLLAVPALLKCTHCGLTAMQFSDEEARNLINAFQSGDLLKCPKCGSDVTGSVNATITLLRQRLEG